MDDAIVQYVKKQYNLFIGEQTAEQIKLRIGSAYKMDEEMEMEVKGRDLIGGIPKTIKISSTEIRHTLQEPLGAIVDAVRESLEKTPPELASDIVDRGIVMTGGGSLLRGFADLLHQETNLPIRVAEDALLCVVLGSGRILDNTEHYEKVLMT